MKRLVLILGMGLIWVSAKANTYDVSSLNDAGAGTLRQAIIDANANASPDTITFSMEGKIALSSPLPNITDTLIIDASSQWSGNTPGDTIDGGGTIAAGLKISNTNECVIRGLVIQNFVIGVWIANSNKNTIGGTGSNHRNIISGNSSGDGILIVGSNNRIIGNYIGTDASGNVAVGNLIGITIGVGMDNEIGGSTVSERNIISGNTKNGILLNSTFASDNVIEGNYIGTQADGTSDLGNGGSGIGLEKGARHNKADSNVIAFNSKGIVVKDDTTDYNRFTKNSIFDNDDLGIDLGDDGAGIPPGGNPNGGIEYPAIDLAAPDIIRGTGPANSTIEIFKDGSDPSGYGEGKVFVTSGVTDGSGNFAIGAIGLIAGDTVSATATDMDGNTSEFSSYKIVEAYQPDNLIALNADFSDAVGADIYNTDGANQSQIQGVPSNDSAIFYIKIENDGSAQDTFMVKGATGTGGWVVTYYDDTTAGNDITTEITGTGWDTGPLNAGDSAMMRVVVEPGITDTLELLTLSTSKVDTAKKDAVKAITYLKMLQPDNQIATKEDGSDYLGDNIYNLDGTDQTQSLSVQPNHTATFYVKIENDGGAPDTFYVKGDSGEGGWDVKYYDQKTGGVDITDSIVDGTWNTPPLVPIQSKEIRIEVIPAASVAPDAQKNILITSTSFNDTTKKDAVKASIEVLQGIEEVSSKGVFRFWFDSSNPSEKGISINYEILKSSPLSLRIYDAAGREVEALISEYQKPGLYHRVWRVKRAGVYFCHLKAEGFTDVRKIVVLK